jgi:hypothetical protein
MLAKTHFAFTICSNNYLGQALALKKSFLEHNPDFGFYIVLVDKPSKEVNYNEFEPALVLPIAAIEGLDIDDLISRYYIIELNTAVKATAFKHIIKQHKQAKAVYYLDPDLYFYSSLQETNVLLETKTAVLTPHILNSIPRDGKKPDENTFLRFGIYNLGFIGINAQSVESKKLLDWWEERTLKFGYDRPNKGYFVDQLWMALSPIFYKDIVVLETYNYNMAPWNLHERQVVSISDNSVLLNDNTNLVFYHFSKLADNQSDISREYDRYTFQDFPLLKQLYDSYREVLAKSKYLEYKNIPIAYPVQILGEPKQLKGSILKRGIKKLSALLSRLGDKF